MYARGLGKLPTCKRGDGSGCETVNDVYCYSVGYFTDMCGAWRAGISSPVPIAPPAIDSSGRATVDGHVVATPEDVQAMLDRQIAEQAAAQRKQTQEDFNRIGTNWGGYIGSKLPDPSTMPDFLPVALVVAGVAALSMFRN